MIRRPPRSTQSRSSAASDVYKRQALHQLLERLRSSGTDHVVAAIKPGLQDLAELLDGFSGRALTNADAGRLVIALTAYKEGLPARVRSLRAVFRRAPRATPSSWIFIPRMNCSIASSMIFTVMHRPMPPWRITAMRASNGMSRSPRKPTGWRLSLIHI